MEEDFVCQEAFEPQIPILISGEKSFKRLLPQKSGLQCDAAALEFPV
jgi:hypothetical protein